MFDWKFWERFVIKNENGFWKIETGEVPYVRGKTGDIENAIAV